MDLNFTYYRIKQIYIVNTEVYTGKASDTDNSVKRIIDRLCEPFHHKHHKIYTDRFYTSLAIA